MPIERAAWLHTNKDKTRSMAMIALNVGEDRVLLQVYVLKFGVITTYVKN